MSMVRGATEADLEALLEEMRKRIRARGAVQLIVVSGPQDHQKRDMLGAAGLTVAAEWPVGEV